MDEGDLRVIHGTPTPEELAALIAVLATRTTPQHTPPPRPRAPWHRPHHTPAYHSPSSWH
ncbi:acyl-CoA carboxylase subunit epsilon [Streptomyces sp. NPDC048111]|uniref:acyl-CoA carboxylase subunit epsilon n=1 Tax=Streptomyces sp. NPDC048111 TaxID=3365500 RepID=UPI003718D9B9